MEAKELIEQMIGLMPDIITPDEYAMMIHSSHEFDLQEVNGFKIVKSDFAEKNIIQAMSLEDIDKLNKNIA